MDSFELNKMIGAFLGVVFIVFSVSLMSDALFSTPAPETPGYHIEVVEQTGDGEAAEEEAVNVAALILDADASAGEAAFRRCASCHALEEGVNRVGPYLWNVVGRQVAAAEGFSYSGAMTEYGAEGAPWEYENLFHFLQNPRSYISGTTMAFAGLSNNEENANLIAYLREQADDPLPLPDPAEAEEEAAGEEGEATEDGAAEGEAVEDDADANGAAGAEGEAVEDDADANGAAEAEGEAADTDAEPVEPSPEDDGTSAGPEPDAGTPAGEDGEATEGGQDGTDNGDAGTQNGDAPQDTPADDEADGTTDAEPETDQVEPQTEDEELQD